MITFKEFLDELVDLTNEPLGAEEDAMFQRAIRSFKKTYGQYVDKYGRKSAVRHAKDSIEKNYDPNIRNRIEKYFGIRP